MLNEVIETVAATATAINTAINAAQSAKSIVGILQEHPIAAVAATAGASSVGTGTIVRAVDTHTLNKANPADMHNFFGRPKKAAKKKEAKKEDSSKEKSNEEPPKAEADQVVETTPNNGEVIDATTTNEAKESAPTECDGNKNNTVNTNNTTNERPKSGKKESAKK